MHRKTEGSGISWMSHPKKIFTMEKAKSKLQAKPPKETKDTFIKINDGQSELKTKETKVDKEGEDKIKSGLKTNESLEKVAVEEDSLSEELDKEIAQLATEERNTLKTSIDHEGEAEDVKDQKKSVDKEDHLINKLKTNKELYETMKKIAKIFDDTSGARITKKAILNGFITSVAEVSNTRDLHIMATLTGTCKETVGQSNFEKTFLHNHPMEYKEPLGSGMSSEVFSGYCFKNGIKQKVAIKKAKSIYSEMVFREAMILSHFNHRNIIKPVAISDKEHAFAMEYMELGSIASALRTHSFTDLDLLNVIRDVASGMEYLHSKDYIHIDLVPLNVLVNGQKQCKISDLGLCAYVGYTNGVYFKKNLADIVAHICPPDAIKSHYFSKASDVWAMGILIYEMYSDIGKPECLKLIEVMAYKSGISRLQKPSRCPENIWTFTVEKMLNKHKNKRTTFSDIKQKCNQLLEQKKNEF